MLQHRREAIAANKALQTPEIKAYAGLTPKKQIMSFKENDYEKENADIFGVLWDFSKWFGDYTNDKLFQRVEFNRLQVVDLYFANYLTFFGSRPFEYFANLSEGVCNRIIEQESEYDPFFELLIRDTLNFVATGKRIYSLNMVRMYMREYRNKIYTDDVDYCLDGYSYSVEKLYVESDLKGLTSEQFFHKWISHRHGAEDLILTYRLLFGKL